MIRSSYKVEAPSSPVMRARHIIVEATVLSADIVGAKQLAAELSALEYFDVLDKHRSIVTEYCVSQGCWFTVVDGDCVISVFESEGSAIDSARVIRENLPEVAKSSFGVSSGLGVRLDGPNPQFSGIPMVRSKNLAKLGAANAVIIDSRSQMAGRLAADQAVLGESFAHKFDTDVEDTVGTEIYLAGRQYGFKDPRTFK